MDPDIIKYPLVNPNLIISVSPDPISPNGLKVPVSLYVEGFEIKEDQTWRNEKNPPKDTKDTKEKRTPHSFNLYTYQIYGLSQKKFKLAVPGKDGTKEHPNGISGGNIRLYVEELAESDANHLQINVPGGHGWDGIATTQGQTLDNGGDGGDGGTANAILGRPFGMAVFVSQLLRDRLDDGKKKWPADFADIVETWVDEMTVSNAIKQAAPLPSGMTNTKEILSTSKDHFKKELKRTQKHLLRPGDNLRNAMSNGIDVSGGSYGTGGTGPNGQGKSGKKGVEGKESIVLTDEYDDILAASTCFLHPVQCQMLLNKAKLYLFLGTDENRARALTLLERLQLRLSILGDPDTPKDLSKTALGQAYRSAEPSLHIVKGDETKEPISIQQLRNIRTEVETRLRELHVPKAKTKNTPIKVPRASFAFYSAYATSFLKELKEVEDAYINYLKHDKSGETKKTTVHERENRCKAAISHRQDLIQTVRHDMDSAAHKVSVAQDTMDVSKIKLTSTLNQLKEKVASYIGLNVDNLISALGQVIFTGGSNWMMANQGLSVAYDSLTKMQNDSGVPIDKRYLVNNITRINGSIEGLKEGFELLKNGGVSFSDPGGSKLAILDTQMEAFINQFSTKLGETTVKGVRDDFKNYIEAVQKRNSAVLSYSQDVQLLLRYMTEIDTFEASRKDLIRKEYNELGTEHPTLTAFMRTMYTNALTGVQVWLHGMQNAYNFCALEDRNIIGEEMKNFNFSSFNYPMLNRINTRLAQAYTDRAAAWGRPPQQMKGIKFPIPNGDTYLQEKGATAKKAMIHATITPDTLLPGTNNHLFGSERVDVRVTSVRFYVDGVVPNGNFLDVWITHGGSETIVDDMNKSHFYDHEPVKTNFRYKMGDKNYTGAGYVKGDIAPAAFNPSVTGQTRDPYALVGPFTTWTIMITREGNDGLELTKAANAHLEFDILFRAKA
ncbi:hypothetical protein MW887_011461 [Aspergillus wentii]|nr:hypothetical protein MW887_011461 [Aspergillus wentii]